jgi:hypothetical protein
MVCNYVSHIKGRTQIEGVWEQDGEKNTSGHSSQKLKRPEF